MDKETINFLRHCIELGAETIDSGAQYGDYTEEEVSEFAAKCEKAWAFLDSLNVTC